MNENANLPHSIKPRPQLIGIIVDASSSMQRNWKHPDGKEMPKIEVIRNALNKQFSKFSIIYNAKRRDLPNIKVFCLGMGLILPTTLGFIDTNNGYEIRLEKEPISTRLTIICDLIALSEMVPSKTLLNSIKKQLNKQWQSYAESYLSKWGVDKQSDVVLKDYISKTLYDTASKKLQRSWRIFILYRLKGTNIIRYRLFKAVSDHLSSYINYWQEKIAHDSQDTAERYFTSINNYSKEIFESNKQDYTNFIFDQLDNFAAEQCRKILELLALGYTSKDVMSTFSEDKPSELARIIYDRLDKDVRKSIATAWSLNEFNIRKAKTILGASIDMNQVNQLTEMCIKKQGTLILKPFIEKVITDIFIKNFEKQAKEMIGHWIGMAEKREVTRSLKQIINLLPDTSEETIYSKEFMFGATPIVEVMNRAILRLLDISHKNRQKVLLIISDGEFDTNAPLLQAEMLKKLGVTIVCCYISGTNVISRLLPHWSRHWPKGAKTLFEMSSKIEDNKDLSHQITVNQIEIPDKAKLFIQVNHSEILEKIIKALIPVEVTV